jgi:hypothetical protein
MARVLRPGGRVGITDMVIERELPQRAKGMLFQVACISGALPASGYIEALEGAGFVDVSHEDHGEVVRELLDNGERYLMGWGMAEQLWGVDLEEMLGMSQEEAREFLQAAYRWQERGDLSYGLFSGRRV